MQIKDGRFDGGKAFDWGRTSTDYAKYRDIYPQEFYQMLVERKYAVKGQKVLDIGTGTGVIPRNMYRFGADFVGTDISENQIAQAKALSEGMNIRYIVSSTEELDFEPQTFDVITASQCFFYFKKEIVYPKLASFLKGNGKLVILYMGWLPYEDDIIKASEDLVLKYNPGWSGYGEKRKKISMPDCAADYFTVEEQVLYDVKIPFTRDSWNGRMKACRGVGASLTDDEIADWETEHIKLLKDIAPPEFELKHYIAMTVLKKI